MFIIHKVHNVIRNQYGILSSFVSNWVVDLLRALKGTQVTVHPVYYCILSAHKVHTYNTFLSTYYLLCWRNEREALQRIDPDYSTFQFRWNWKLANSIWQLYRWLVCEIAIFKWFAHTLRCHGNKEISCWLVENWIFLPFCSILGNPKNKMSTDS